MFYNGRHNSEEWRSDMLYDVDTTAIASDIASGVRTAKVYGTPVLLADQREYLAVACPFCHKVHFHQPFRRPPPSPTCVVTAPTCVVAAPPTDGHAIGDTDAGASAKTSSTIPTSLEVAWETDRVALCRNGTYYIIGGCE